MSKATDLADLAVSEARAGTDPTRCLAIAVSALALALTESPLRQPRLPRADRVEAARAATSTPLPPICGRHNEAGEQCRASRGHVSKGEPHTWER